MKTDRYDRLGTTPESSKKGVRLSQVLTTRVETPPPNPLVSRQPFASLAIEAGAAMTAVAVNSGGGTVCLHARVVMLCVNRDSPTF